MISSALSILLLLQNQLFAQVHLIDYFEKVAVTSLCESGQYFYECFDNQKSCQMRMRGFVQGCLDENSRPSEISPVLSLRMGMCLGDRFEKKYRNEKKSHPKCFQSDKWAQNE